MALGDDVVTPVGYGRSKTAGGGERKMKLRTQMLVLAVCAVLLASISGVVSAQISTTLTTQTADSRALPPPPVPLGLAIDQQQTTSSGADYMGYCDGHPWQSFVPYQSVLAGGAIHIEFDNPTNCEELTMHIRTSPDGSDLTSVTIPKSEIVVGEWAVFNFPDISVTPGNTYYIVMDDEGEVSYYGWSIQRDYDAYSPGRACTYETYDWTFVTYYSVIITPTVSISTDCFKYSTGDTMIRHLEIDNPTASPVTFNWYLGVPQFAYWGTIASAPIPAGFSYSGDSPFPVGDWGSTPFGMVWYVELTDGTGEVLDSDAATCAYSPLDMMVSKTSDAVGAIEESIRKAGQ